MEENNFTIMIDGSLVTTCYTGLISVATIQQVLAKWSELKERQQELSIFLFDYSHAKMADIDFQHAIDIANYPIFNAKAANEIYIVGVLSDRRDYAISCLWATQLFKSRTFPRENVFLYRSLDQAIEKIGLLQKSENCGNLIGELTKQL